MRATYRELAPPPALASHVSCLWTRRPGTDEPQDGHPVLPDGAIDLVWHAGRLVVAGPDTAARHVAADPDAAARCEIAVGVRLRPGAGALVVGERAAELRDRSPGAAEIWGAAGAELEERVSTASAAEERLRVLAAAIGRRAVAVAPPDPAVAGAVAALGRPQATVAGTASALGVGERWLHRRFLDHVGYGPKTLQRILRLQRTLALVSGARAGLASRGDLSRLAFAAGYADQAHLSREVRALAGTTPSALVARWRPVSGPGSPDGPTPVGWATDVDSSVGPGPRGSRASETSKTGGRRSATIPA